MVKKLLLFNLLLSYFTLARPGVAQVVQYLPPLVAARAVPLGLVGVSRVVDARPGRPPVLGYSLAGGADPQPVLFAQSLAPTLVAFLQQQVPPDKKPGQELVLRLTRLELEEVNLQTLARLEAEFYLVAPDSSYQLVARYTQATQRLLTGKRETALIAHSQNLSDVLLRALEIGAMRRNGGPTDRAACAINCKPLRRPGPRARAGLFWPRVPRAKRGSTALSMILEIIGQLKLTA